MLRLPARALLLALLLLVPVAPSHAASAWSCDNSGGPACFAHLFGVDHVGGQAWAVGENGWVLRGAGGGWTGSIGAAGTSLDAVDMLSDGEGWAVGTGNSTHIWRYSGGQWTNANAPYPGHNATLVGGLDDIDMLGETEEVGSGPEGWAVGYRSIMHYSNGAWAVDPYSSAAGELTAVDFVSPDEGWAVDGNSANDGRIIHWTRDDDWWYGDTVPWTDGLALFDIDMVSGSKGWAVGTRGTILKYTGTRSWSVEVAPNALTTKQLNTVVMLDENNGYAAGVGIALRYANGTWSVLDSAVAASILSLASGSGGSVTAVGTGSAIYTGAGGGALSRTVPAPVTNQNLYGVDLDAAGAGYAVGDSGIILRGGSGGWVVDRANASGLGDLNDVSTLASGEAYAAGQGTNLFEASIWRRAGGAWVAETLPATDWWLSGIDMVSADEGIAVSEDGWGLTKTAGGAWQYKLYCGGNAVDMVAPGEAWIARDSGFIGRYKDGACTTVGRDLDATGQLDAISMVSPTEGWAVGGQGDIVHINDGTISDVPPPAGTESAFFKDVAMISPTEGWITISHPGKILHYVNGSWRVEEVPASVHDVDLTPGGGAAVGANGRILRLGGASPCSGQPLPAQCILPLEVNTTGDDSDTTTADGRCDVDGATEGPQCTLRAAIQEANARAGADDITFDLPGSGVARIAPASALPAISGPVTIDGGSEAAGRVELHGAQAGTGASGLVLQGGESRVTGLVVNAFPAHGIVVESDGNTLTGNRIGTDVAGAAAAGNGRDGIVVRGSRTTIGGPDAAAANLVSANGAACGTCSGILVESGAGNVIRGNRIGTDAAGTGKLGHPLAGVFLTGGDNTRVEDNLLSGNLAGIGLGAATASAGTNRTVIAGNRIGTDAAGAAAVANTFGIMMLGTVRDTVVGPGNVVSGNTKNGIQVAHRDVVGTRIEGNTIGLAADGVRPLRNGMPGIELSGGATTVGGTTAGTGNVVAGNTEGQIAVFHGAHRILGNRIGLTAKDTNPDPNATTPVGVYVGGDATGGTVIGAPGAGNVIGTNGVGVLVKEAKDITIQANDIGLTAAGAFAGNALGGVWLVATANTKVGGATVGAGNVISANGGGTTDRPGAGYAVVVAGSIPAKGPAPIALAPSGAEVPVAVASASRVRVTRPRATTAGMAEGNAILGNRIGTSAAGTKAEGNQGDGIYIGPKTRDLQIGQPGGGGNVIAANGGHGIVVTGTVDGLPGAEDVSIGGNRIGVTADGRTLGNDGHGVLVGEVKRLTLRENRIAANRTGIAFERAALGVRLRSNMIFENDGLGIAPDGASRPPKEDFGDADRLQNRPVIEAVAGRNVTVAVPTMPRRRIEVEVFENATCDKSGFGEGATPAAMKAGTADADGLARITLKLPRAPAAAHLLSATATPDPTTDLARTVSTSDFSACAGTRTASAGGRTATLAGGRLGVTVTCPAASARGCRGTISLATQPPAPRGARTATVARTKKTRKATVKPVTLGRRAFRVARGRRATVRVTLPGAKLKALRVKRVRVRATVVTAGQPGRAETFLRLRRR